MPIDTQLAGLALSLSLDASWKSDLMTGVCSRARFSAWATMALASMPAAISTWLRLAPAPLALPAPASAPAFSFFLASLALARENSSRVRSCSTSAASP